MKPLRVEVLNAVATVRLVDPDEVRRSIPTVTNSADYLARVLEKLAKLSFKELAFETHRDARAFLASLTVEELTAVAKALEPDAMWPLSVIGPVLGRLRYRHSESRMSRNPDKEHEANG